MDSHHLREPPEQFSEDAVDKALRRVEACHQVLESGAG